MKEDFITGALPKTVEINNATYPIRTDFRIGMKFDKIRTGNLDDKIKIIKLLQMYYPQIPDNIAMAIDRMLWFYRCGEAEGKEDDEKNKRQRYQQRTSKDPAYSFSQDAPYIYAAFKEQYGIDLTESEMHWWKFMALFESLNENTKMSRIMYYRKVSTSGLPKEKRFFINEMKKLYRITDNSISGKSMSLEVRNKKWRDYVRTRLREAGVM